MSIDTIHHAGLISDDLGGTVAQFERLGFQFTPLSLAKVTLRPGEPPVYIGLGSRNAIFERNFLDLAGVTDAKIWASVPVEQRGPFDIDRRLKSYRGMHIVHFGTDDIEAVRARYIAHREPVSDIARLEHVVETPEGPRLLEVKTLHFPAAANPEALIQIVQTMTPEYALQPRYMKHANGARQMTEVIVCSAAPEALAAKYSRYTDKPAILNGPARQLDLGYSRVLVVDPTQLGRLVPGCVAPALPFVAGFTVASTDLRQTEHFLRQRGIHFQRHDGRLAVSPDQACGASVLFESIGATR